MTQANQAMGATAPSSGSVLGFIYRWLFDHDFQEGFHQQVERTIAALILLSVFAIVLEHIPEIHAPNEFAITLDSANQNFSFRSLAISSTCSEKGNAAKSPVVDLPLTARPRRRSSSPRPVLRSPP